MGKKLANVESKVDTTKEYTIDEAVSLVKDNSYTKFAVTHG